MAEFKALFEAYGADNETTMKRFMGAAHTLKDVAGKVETLWKNAGRGKSYDS